jgi:oxygen-independent coproporphyrinogen-3 oxidase
MPAITADLLTRFDVPGPRYTSYPTADRFIDTFKESDYIDALEKNRAQLGQAALPLSLYVHIPFCESLCYYCACNKIITRHHERSAPMLQYITREVELQLPHLGQNKRVSQLHLGGGTPTFFNDEELAELVQMLRARFEFMPEGEYSIEIDPRTVDAKRLAAIKELGFNRISLGVQDFDPAVQKAVHRTQPYERVAKLIGHARRIGFDSINMDLIYGLPKQTTESFHRTLEQVATLRPDRIALYAYAHLPTRFMAQRRIHAVDLPPPPDKVGMLAAALAGFEKSGYVYIGMDHFALPQDSLAIAKSEGKLHRNFQGYSTQPDCDLIGLGVSAIGKIGPTYSQNAKTVDEYQAAIDQGHLPVIRGLMVNSEDLLRREVIMALMCQGQVDFEQIERQYSIDFHEHFSKELERLDGLADDGLVELTADGIKVTEMGWFFVRGVAIVFDHYLQQVRDRTRFSKII